MASRLIERFKKEGPAVFARCRQLLRDDDAAAEATVAVFGRAVFGRTGKDLVAVADQVCRARQKVAAVTETTPDPAAEERFRQRYLEKLVPAVEHFDRPLVLRWVWYFGPVLVACAMAGMFFAARSAGGKRKLAIATAAVEVYSEKGGHTYRVTQGARLQHGQPVELVAVPGGARHVLIIRDGVTLAELGPLEDSDGRVRLPDVALGAPGHLHVDAFFSRLPLAPASVKIALERGRTAELDATRVSFDADID